MFVVSAMCLVGISLVHYSENRLRDRKQEFGQDEPENVAFMDWTEWVPTHAPSLRGLPC